MPHFKVQTRVGLAAAIAYRRNRIARLNPLAHLLIQTFIIAVQAHIAFAMIDNDQVSKATQPLGKHHLTRSNRLYRCTLSARMNSPFQLTPPPSLGAPKRFMSSPETGKRNEPFKLENERPE